MEALAYYDGKIGTPEELTVPFNDRVHFFGDGVYDATVGANGKVYLMQDHLDRFYTSAKALDINIPMPKEELGKLLTDLLAKVDGTTHFVYWQVTRGVETRNHVYAENLPGKLWVSIRQNHLNDPDVPIKLNTEEDTRFYHCNIKTLNLLPSVAAVQVSADGQPIVMLADHQTTGGYAKIATVISADLPALAQLRPGQRACFTFVTPSRAVQAARQQAALWQRVRDRL